MSKVCEELEFEFSNIETKFQNKIEHSNKLYQAQIELLDEKFNIEHLTEKYSNELNNYRDELLKQISLNTRSEIELVNQNGLNQNKNELKKVKFKRSKLDLKCVRKLINIEFSLGRRLSDSQLVKYKSILGFSDFISTKLKEADKKIGEALLQAVHKGNLEVVKILVDNGADVNSSVSKNTRALILAAERDKFEIVKYLVENGADVNLRDYGNTTALMMASFENLEIVRYLIEKGADVNAKNNNKYTALSQATLTGHIDIVKCLVENGIDVNSKDYFDNTALISASENGRLNIVKYLVEHGADVNIANELNITALSIASQLGRFEVVKYLVENGADVTKKNSDNKTPLMLAKERGNSELIRYLTRSEANANRKGDKRKLNENLRIARLVVKTGAVVLIACIAYYFFGKK